MTYNDISSAICRIFDISALNPMQIAVAKSTASRIMLLSPTGTGKTLAFTTKILEKTLNGQKTGISALVIAPSRELVRQIFDVVRPVAATFGLKTLAVYGGNSFRDEQTSLAGATPDIVVATPGRLLDHLNRGTVTISRLKALVYDEYDKTLELGFHDEIRDISRRLAPAGQHEPELVMLTSATRLDDFPPFMSFKEAEEIDFTAESDVSSRLRIVNVPSPSADKLDTLAALVRAQAQHGQCIVFVNHRESAERVGNFLKKQKISCVVYHGGLDQHDRETSLARFAAKAAKVLVSTDLAGRGLDIEAVNTVIHYHPAADERIWTHRNGRTARVDRTGEVFVITGPEENRPEFVDYENDYYPDMTASGPVFADYDMIYLDRGKRDKLSRGDIAGFLMKKVEIPAPEIGKITIGANYALVAIKHHYVKQIIEKCKTEKIKNVKVRATILLQ